MTPAETDFARCPSLNHVKWFAEEVQPHEPELRASLFVTARDMVCDVFRHSPIAPVAGPAAIERLAVVEGSGALVTPSP